MQENPGVVDQIVEFIEKNKILIISVIAFIGLLSAGAGLYQNHLTGQQKKAFSQAYALDKQLTEILAKNTVGKDFLKNFPPLEAQAKTFVNKNTNKHAAVFLAVKLSSIYAKQGDDSKVVELLQPLVENYDKSSIYFGLLNINYANALINLQKFEESVSSLKSVLNQPTQKYLHPTALLKLGIVYKELGRLDEAKKQFERVVSDFPKSQNSQTAKGLLRYLATKQG